MLSITWARSLFFVIGFGKTRFPERYCSLEVWCFIWWCMLVPSRLHGETLCEGVIHQLVGQFGGRIVGMRDPFLRGELHDVESDDPFLFADQSEEFHGFRPEEPVWLRGSGARHEGRVEGVDVERDVDMIRQVPEHFFDPSF